MSKTASDAKKTVIHSESQAVMVLQADDTKVAMLSSLVRHYTCGRKEAASKSAIGLLTYLDDDIESTQPDDTVTAESQASITLTAKK